LQDRSFGRSKKKKAIKIKTEIPTDNTAKILLFIYGKWKRIIKI
jgi:hypothetical protein